MGHSSTHATDEWSAVVRAIEIALPFYESTSEIISLGLAGPLRRRAIRRLEKYRTNWILDSGTGPGTSSRMMLESRIQFVLYFSSRRIALRLRGPAKPKE